MKICRKCGIEKTAHQFAVDRKAKDGRQSWCHDCKGKSDRQRPRGATGEQTILEFVVAEYGNPTPVCEVWACDTAAVAAHYLKARGIAPWLSAADVRPTGASRRQRLEFVGKDGVRTRVVERADWEGHGFGGNAPVFVWGVQSQLDDVEGGPYDEVSQPAKEHG